MTEMRNDLYTLTTRDIRRCGPKPMPLIPGMDLGVCVSCHEPFRPGDDTGWVGLGPGKDPELRRQARAGLPYAGVFVEVHWACLTGREE